MAQRDLQMLSEHVERVSRQLDEFEEKLRSDFLELQSIDPAIAKGLEDYFGDHAFAMLIMYSKIEELGGRSYMRIALDEERNPMDVIRDQYE